LNKQQAYRLKQEKAKLKRAALIFTVILAVVITPLVITAYKNAHPVTTHQKALDIGLRGAPPAIEERHVQITEHPQVVGRHGDITVHIMFRKDEQSQWGLCGTGTRLGKYPSAILTAYHVFEGRTGQFGFRKIGPNELTGKEQIFPIVSCQPQNADDAVICTADTNSSNFPVIAMPVSTNMFKDFVDDESYETSTYPTKVHFSTYPEKSIQNVLHIKVGAGSYHMVFDWEVMPGESGTSASVESMGENDYLVIIRSFKIPKRIWELCTPENKQLLNWSEDKVYGLVTSLKSTDQRSSGPSFIRGSFYILDAY
jgi:hypothetical protein